MRVKKVVTAFLRYNKKILLLRRSRDVGSYRGRWAGISGYLEEGETPKQRALLEIEEETGTPPERVRFVSEGTPLTIQDEKMGILWVVYPLLFQTSKPKIKLDWEHVEAKWVNQEELNQYKTVPNLLETFRRVSRPEEDFGGEIGAGIGRIASDRSRGAHQLSLESLRVMCLAAETCSSTTIEGYLDYLEQVGRKLVFTRPSMSPIANTVQELLFRVRKASEKMGLDELKVFTLRSVETIIEEVVSAAERVSEQALPLIEDGSTVMTHSLSSTVIKTIGKTFKAGKKVSVVLTESRPLCEGVKTAEKLSEMGVPVTLVVDSAAPHTLQDVDLVVIGADSVLASGAVVNKIGTLPIALAANHWGVPLYVLSDTYKFNTRNYLGQAVILEEKSSTEIINQEKIPGVKIRNLYFDITPPEYITGIVTETGVIPPETVREEIEKMLSKQWAV
ncbi:MAG: hypothetical protein DRO11_04705 [Methanobacteriota archaeon]|nr:MAG: hypothetical protein DRO11_04705 [Euryarchaeota archaeon]